MKRHVIKTNNFSKFYLGCSFLNRNAIATKKRKYLEKNPIIKNLNIMDSTIFEKPKIQPIIFEDIFLKEADDYEGENFETEEN